MGKIEGILTRLYYEGNYGKSGKGLGLVDCAGRGATRVFYEYTYIKTMETNSLSKEEQVLEFKEIKDKKIILSVESVMNSEAKEFTIGF